MIRRTLARLIAFLPALALAHPGHYHPPGEVDEFDTLDRARADWLHLHGWTEVSIAAALVGSILLFHFSKNRKVRIGAIIAFGGCFALLAAS